MLQRCWYNRAQFPGRAKEGIGVQSYRGLGICFLWADPGGEKRGSPWRWKPIQELEVAGWENCSWIPSLLPWGHPFMGARTAAGQDLLPVIRWGLEKLPRVQRER